MMMDGDAFAVAVGLRARHRRDLQRYNAAIADRDAVISNLNAQIRDLQEALAVEQCHSAGRETQFKAFMDAHADSPLMADTGNRFKSGKIKTKARLMYEAAFDATAKRLGIPDPKKFRND